MKARHYITHKLKTKNKSRRQIAAEVKEIALKNGLNTDHIRMEGDILIIPHISKHGKITDHVFVEV